MSCYLRLSLQNAKLLPLVEAKTRLNRYFVDNDNVLKMATRSKLAKTADVSLESISKQLEKLSLLDEIQRDIRQVKGEFEALKTKVENLETGQRDLENALSHLDEDSQDLKSEVSLKAEKAVVEELKNKIEELENEARRNNILIVNFPENMEREHEGSSGLAKYLFTEVMEIDGSVDFKLVKAYRIGQKREDRRRPLLVRFVSTLERNIILKEAPRKLKGKDVEGSKIIITDDVCQKTQARRRRLLPKMFDLRSQGHQAFIPWDMQPGIKYRDCQNGQWKFIREEDTKQRN